MSGDAGLAFACRQLARRVLNSLGIEVRLLRNVRAARAAERRGRELNTWRLLATRPFACILDIGANEGQFAAIARRLWSGAVIHSFEPLPDVHASLLRRFADDARIFAHNIGLSEHPGTQKMRRSAFSPSSSLLPMAELHRDEWPQTADYTEVEVSLVRLDDWAEATGLAMRPMLIKIDVQGFEQAVLDGGAQTLRCADVVVIEVSYYELYQGQPLFAAIHERMAALGFFYRGNVEQCHSKDRTRILQADAIFENMRTGRLEGV